MFGWEFPPYNSGGLGTACFGLTRALAKRGAKITFVLPRRVNARADFAKLIFADNEVEIKVVDSLLTPYITSEEFALAKSLARSDLYGSDLFNEVRRYALRAKQIAKQERFDVIHAHEWLSFGAGLEAKKVSGKPLVVHVHATEFDRTGGHNVNSQVYAIEREGMEKADAVIAVSHFTKQTIIERYGIASEKVHVVHNGIDPDLRAHTEVYGDQLSALKKAGNKIVLFVGRLTLQKGPDYFVRMAKRVLEYRKNVYFVVAGAGDMDRKIMQEAAYLGISDRVLFTGFLRDEELARTYRAADLFVMPSVSEPFGITPLEALLHGTPVLISKQSGVSEILSNALKADFWDIDEMTNKIIAVLDHESLRTSLQANGGEEVTHHGWQEAAAKCFDLYRSMLLTYA